MSHLTKLKLKNFGIHEEFETQFENGLIVIRGGNGSGKSTLATQSILYAMFGIQSLNGTVDELTNDNYSPASMQVELDYGPFIVRRSKTSATVVRKDRQDFQIAGQNEVSQFFRELFGIPKGAEKMILVAAQDDLTGILSKGSAETTKFIEQAAGFYQLDEIIEEVKLKLRIYNTDQLEEQIATDQTRIEESENSIVTNKSEIETLNEEITDLTDELEFNETLKLALESTVTKIKEAIIHNDNRRNLSQVLDDEREFKLGLVGQLHALDLVKFDTLSEEELEELNSEIAEADFLIQKRKQYEKFLIVESEFNNLSSVWEGTVDSFQVELSTLKEEVETKKKQVIELKYIESRIPNTDNETKCTACGREFDDLDEIKKHNEELAEKRAVIKKELELLNYQLKDRESELYSFQEVVKNEDKLSRLGLYEFDLNRTTYPPKPLWIYPEPEIIDSSYVKERLDKIKSNSEVVKEMMVHQNRRSVLVTKIDNSTDRISELKSKLDSLQIRIVDTDKLKSSEEDLLKVKSYISNLESTASEKLKSRTELLMSVKNLESNIKYHKDQIAESISKIKESKKNQKYLSNLRKARQSVINTVWSTITESVSHRFNEITGLGYRLVKEDKYFKCDTGLEKLRPVYRLSGSEQVSLGIAFREVLKMIFAPSCSFMVLDEPFASMSKERTSAAMVAISNMAGQVIVITHEDVSELSAQQLIEVD